MPDTRCTLYENSTQIHTRELSKFTPYGDPELSITNYDTLVMGQIGQMTHRRVLFYTFGFVSPFIFYLLYTLDYSIRVAPQRFINYGDNYLEVHGPKEIIVDLPGCVIPVEVESFVLNNKRHPEFCTQPSLTFVQGNILSINSTFHGVSCCYKAVVRKFGRDNESIVSQLCTKIDNSVEIELEDAVVVDCWYKNRTYREYHPIVRRKSMATDDAENVPNIVIIGLDSVSRFHFHKLMPKTRQVLKQLGSIEFLGYTKVGENTFPNTIAMLTGYEEDQVSKFCYKAAKPIDSCPFIWKNLRMTTAIVEDAPRLAMFNYLKFGFLNPPTNHYLRPLMLTAAKDYLRNYKYLFPCVGSVSTESFLLNHIEQLIRIESELFLFTWFTTLAHEDADSLPAADPMFADFFLKQNFNNTIIIFLSDHGHRFGDNRRSFNGWYNEKLPYLTITIPPKVESFLGGKRMTTLKSNVNKLTTPLDVYHTLSEILTAYKVKDVENVVVVNEKPFPRTHGQSLFSSVSINRTCVEAGIPNEYCACTELDGMNLSDPVVEYAIHEAIAKINSFLPTMCRQLSLEQITAAAKINDDEFVVGFKTTGKFHYETIVNKSHQKIGHITRVNRVYNGWCVNDSFLELYCYCIYD